MAFEDRSTAPLSPGQEDTLRTLAQAEGLRPAEQYDGRTLAALARRGLIESTENGVRATSAGAHYFNTSIRRRRRGRTREGVPGARGRAILETIETLELALPSGAELRVGSEIVSLADLLSGLREFAANQSSA